MVDRRVRGVRAADRHDVGVSHQLPRQLVARQIGYQDRDVNERTGGNLRDSRLSIRRLLRGRKTELRPVRPKSFAGMLRAFFAVAAAQIVGRAVPVAAPADALRMCGVNWYPSCHFLAKVSVERPLSPNSPAGILLQSGSSRVVRESTDARRDSDPLTIDSRRPSHSPAVILPHG